MEWVHALDRLRTMSIKRVFALPPRLIAVRDNEAEGVSSAIRVEECEVCFLWPECRTFEKTF
jgi:hypothetical protein